MAFLGAYRSDIRESLTTRIPEVDRKTRSQFVLRERWLNPDHDRSLHYIVQEYLNRVLYLELFEVENSDYGTV